MLEVQWQREGCETVWRMGFGILVFPFSSPFICECMDTYMSLYEYVCILSDINMCPVEIQLWKSLSLLCSCCSHTTVENLTINVIVLCYMGVHTTSSMHTHMQREVCSPWEWQVTKCRIEMSTELGLKPGLEHVAVVIGWSFGFIWSCLRSWRVWVDLCFSL